MVFNKFNLLCKDNCNKSKNKQIGINLIASIVSFVVSIGISFFLVPYIVEKIGKEAYGFAGLAESFTHYAGIISMALNSMAGRFITISLKRDEKEEAVKYISSVFFANILLAIPMSIIGTIIIISLYDIVQVSEELLPSVQLLWSLIFIGFIINLITSVFSCSTFVNNRLEISSVVNICNSVIRAVILIFLFGFFTPLIWYIGISNLVCTIISSVAGIYIFKNMMPDIHISKAYVELKKITILISSGIWNSISQLSSILLEELDLLIVNLYVNAGAMGIVSIAKSLPVKLLAFFTLFGNAFSPQITIDYAKGNKEELKREIISACRLVSFCSSIPMVFVYIYGREFFSLWVPSQDSTKLYILSILACLEFPFVIPFEPMWKVFTAANKTRQTAIVAIVTAITSVSLTFGLLQFTNDEFTRTCIVVGVSSCLGILRGTLFLPLYGARCVGVKWNTFYPVLIKNICCLFIGCFVAYGLKKIIVISGWFNLILIMMILSVFIIFINSCFLLSKIERTVILRKVLKFK